MYFHLSIITQEILIRKNLNWDESVIPQELPPIKDDLCLIELFGILFNHYFSQMNGDKCTCSKLKNHIDKIYQSKKVLNSAWIDLSQVAQKSRQWYMHDILFFIGLCAHLQESLQLSMNFCDLSELPSEHGCSVYSSEISMDTLLKNQEYFNQFPFLKIALTIPSRLFELSESIKTNNRKNRFILTDSVNRLIKMSSFSMAHERYYIHVLSKLQLTKFNANNKASQDRQILSVTISLIMQSIEETREIIEMYLHSLHNLYSQAEYLSEYLYWKLYYNYIKTFNLPDPSFKKQVLIRIKFILNKIKECINQPSATSEPLFQWQGSPQEFVNHFYNLIADKKISLGGNYDIEPFARQLHKTISIKKDKGSGYLSCGSLLTYFKQLHADIK
nr:hypothetical protein [uncultured Carboxylicivirga sp.]